MDKRNILKDKLSYFSNISQFEIADTKEILASIEHAIKISLDKKPDLSPEYIEETINNMINEYLFKLNSPTRSDLYLFKTLQYMIKHPNIISQTLYTMDINNLLNPKDNKFTYTSNIESNYKTVLQDAFVILKDKINPNIKEKLLNNTLTENEMKILQSDINKFLKFFYDELYNKMIKDGYSNKLINYVKILDYTGILPKYNTINNKKLHIGHLDFLAFNYEKNENDGLKRAYIKQLMDPEFIKNFSTDEIIAMSTFYSNKVAKAIKNYNYSLYIIYKTNLISKYIENPNYSFDLSDKEISNILTQYKLLRVPARNYLEDKTKNTTEIINNFDPKEAYKDIKNPIIEKTISLYGKNYLDEFKSLIPNYNHDLMQDLTKTICLDCASLFAYKNKDDSLESLLLMLIDKDKERNWGIILEDSMEGQLKQNQNNDLLICIDMKEFNMPLTVHCSMNKIKNFMLNYTGKPYIPVYKGNEDMLIDNKFFSTYIYMKLSKEQRKYLNQEASKISSRGSFYYKYLKHIQWMSHPKRPPEFIDNTNLFLNLNNGIIYNEKDINQEIEK